MRIIAIIPARGGSKRIPHKNKKDFCGKPIIAYSILAAIHSGIFDEIMVSTDSSDIANIAREYGAQVPFLRSEQNSSDYAGTEDVLYEVLQRYKDRGQIFDVVCCLYPTAPFITPAKLKMAVQSLLHDEADALIPIVRFSFPPQRSFIIENGRLAYKWPQYATSRSQDLPPYFHDAGQFYFWNIKAFLERKIEKTVPMILDESEVQDIDNLSDWRIAEMKYRLLESK